VVAMDAGRGSGPMAMVAMAEVGVPGEGLVRALALMSSVPAPTPLHSSPLALSRCCSPSVWLLLWTLLIII
jgi:hypothetical protein